MSLSVIEAGMLTTVQDLGRFGYRRFGMLCSGAMDSLSARLANSMLANPENSAVLEYTLIGPTLTFHKPAAVCLCGGISKPVIDDHPANINSIIFIKAGQTLKIGAIKTGCRGYLAIKGGFIVPEILGSASTYLRGKVGGLNGRRIQESDSLTFAPFSENSDHLSTLSPSPDITEYLWRSDKVRYIRGPQYHWFSDNSILSFNREPFSINSNSDRMGYRLTGPEISLRKTQELLSEGVAPGSIQIPPNGQPIILMSDSQPTGGYPKIAQVATIDIPRVAQMKPGDTLGFQEISLAQAQQELMQQRILLDRMTIAAIHHWNAPLERTPQ